MDLPKWQNMTGLSDGGLRETIHQACFPSDICVPAFWIALHQFTCTPTPPISCKEIEKRPSLLLVWTLEGKVGAFFRVPGGSERIDNWGYFSLLRCCSCDHGQKKKTWGIMPGLGGTGKTACWGGRNLPRRRCCWWRLSLLARTIDFRWGSSGVRDVLRVLPQGCRE